jgi:hypothetical protein
MHIVNIMMNILSQNRTDTLERRQIKSAGSKEEE